MPQPSVPQSGPQPYTPIPAFQLGRFKKNLHADFNEEFGESLLELLNTQEQLPSHLYTFRQKLEQRLHDGFYREKSAAS